MTCRITTENVSEPLPNLAELLAVNRSLPVTRPTRRRRHLNRSCACQPTYSAVTDGMTWDDPAATARACTIGAELLGPSFAVRGMAVEPTH
jgi:hypothetical protein